MRYEIHGTTMQTVAIDLSRGETIYSQTATMAWMNEAIRMDTHILDTAAYSRAQMQLDLQELLNPRSKLLYKK